MVHDADDHPYAAQQPPWANRLTQLRLRRDRVAEEDDAPSAIIVPFQEGPAAANHPPRVFVS